MAELGGLLVDIHKLSLTSNEGATIMSRSLCIFVLFAIVSPVFGQVRTWTDNTGSFTVEAELVEVLERGIRLRRTKDGSLIAVPWERLSEDDRQHALSRSPLPKEPAQEDRDARPPKQQPGTARQTRTTPVASGYRAIERALSQPSGLSSTEMRLSDMVRQVAATHQIPVFLDLYGVRYDGIRADTPVKIANSNATLDQTLTDTLEPKSLTWFVSQGVLVISKQDVAESMMEPVVYGLVHPLDFDNMAEEIRTEIAPRSWAENGGPGRILHMHGGAVVVQTSVVHRQLAKEYENVLVRVVLVEPPTSQHRSLKHLVGLASVVNCDYSRTSLDSVITDLSRQSGVPIALDAEALPTLGVAADAPVTFTLRGARLDSTLTLLLRSFELSWIPDETGITITSLDKAQNTMQQVTYVVQDLWKAARMDSDTLLNIIFSTVAPRSWQVLGGAGSIKPRNGRLHIEQNYHIHKRIEELLMALRQVSRR